MENSFKNNTLKAKSLCETVFERSFQNERKQKTDHAVREFFIEKEIQFTKMARTLHNAYHVLFWIFQQKCPTTPRTNNVFL